MLRDVIFKGPSWTAWWRWNRRELTVSAPPETVGLVRGGNVWIGWTPEAAAAFQADDRWIDGAAPAPQPAGRLFVLLFLILPLLSVVVFSFWRTESYVLIPDWNLDNYATILGEAPISPFLAARC